MARKILTTIAVLLAIGLSVAGVYAYRIYSRLYKPNVVLPQDQPHVFVTIPSGANYREALDQLFSADAIADTATFKWASSRMGYPHSLRAGRYRITHEQSNRELLNMLRAGLQVPTRVTFISFRTPSQLAQRVSNQIEADSVRLVEAFTDTTLIESLGFTPETFMAMFIPNTYEVFWNTSTNGFLQRMKREYENFWNTRRDSLAESIGLTRNEVSTLASIIEEETNMSDERARIAGVYINRLQRRMPLQADPTVKFAVGDFSIRRVLNRHLRVDSPYNTYRHPGIPPGPICAPSIASIDAVLNYENSSYLYFCARPDYSGYHTFSRNLREHNRNARIYQQWLNQQRIFR